MTVFGDGLISRKIFENVFDHEFSAL